jgi:hypothetical protein
MMDPQVTRLRPEPDEYADAFARYVTLVPAGEIVARLDVQVRETTRPLERVSVAAADRPYAPGKWTIKQVIGHLSDTERVFGYRALRFGRGDPTPLLGFDQDPYVAAGEFGRRPLQDLIDEWIAVRRATVLLFRGLPAEGWSRRGVASGHEVTVRALAWIIAGHELHHRRVLSERYAFSG